MVYMYYDMVEMAAYLGYTFCDGKDAIIKK